MRIIYWTAYMVGSVIGGLRHIASWMVFAVGCAVWEVHYRAFPQSERMANLYQFLMRWQHWIAPPTSQR